MPTNLPPTAPIEPEPLWITAIVKGPDVASVDRAAGESHAALGCRQSRREALPAQCHAPAGLVIAGDGSLGVPRHEAASGVGNACAGEG
jgi:hypothetical protein